MSFTYAQLKQAIQDSNEEIAKFFGLEGVDITKTEPADLTSDGSSGQSEAAKKYGAVLAGLSEMGKQ